MNGEFPLTTRVVSLSAPQSQLRKALITELVQRWQDELDRQEEEEEEEGKKSNEEEEEEEESKLSTMELLQGVYAITRRVDQLAVPEKTACSLPPIEYLLESLLHV